MTSLRNKPEYRQKMSSQNSKIKMKIIPAIDIIEGKCVRLTQGDYAQKKIYNENQ